MSLDTSQNIPMRMAISDSPENRVEGEYELTGDGLKNKKSKLSDKVITIITELSKTDDNYINLPVDQRIYPFIGLIYISELSYNLIDTSIKGDISINVTPDDRILLEHGMVLIFGCMHYFYVDIQNSVYSLIGCSDC